MSAPDTPRGDSAGQPFWAGEPFWLRPNGSPVSCVEKIKVLNQNYHELRALALDALDDALLMGCSDRQFRRILHDMIDDLSPSVVENRE